jgi:hypothetical protein
MVKKSIRMMEEAIVDGQTYREVLIDVEGLNYIYDPHNSAVSLMIPTFRIEFPIITPEANKAFFDAGLNEVEIDDALAMMMDEVQKRIITKLLYDRIK